jgi:hypothetical protein
LAGATAAAGLLAACSSSADDKPPATASGDEHIACALDGAQKFSNCCAVERVQQDGKLYLVVQRPDGGFRRFEVLNDGRGLAVADGSQQAKTRLAGDTLEVTVGADRYRFPATRTGHDSGV